MLTCIASSNDGDRRPYLVGAVSTLVVHFGHRRKPVIIIFHSILVMRCARTHAIVEGLRRGREGGVEAALSISRCRRLRRGWRCRKGRTFWGGCVQIRSLFPSLIRRAMQDRSKGANGWQWRRRGPIRFTRKMVQLQRREVAGSR
jgi:hypothetical protein